MVKQYFRSQLAKNLNIFLKHCLKQNDNNMLFVMLDMLSLLLYIFIN